MMLIYKWGCPNKWNSDLVVEGLQYAICRPGQIPWNERRDMHTQPLQTFQCLEEVLDMHCYHDDASKGNEDLP